MEANDKQELTSKVKLSVNDAIEGLKIFALNPVSGLSSFFERLGKERALGVGITFGVIYTCCIVFSAKNILDKFFNIELSFAGLVILGIANFLSIVGASFITRKVFKGHGCIKSDFFITGVALTPLCLLIVATQLLGIENIEIILVVLILAITYTILMLYTGLNRISNISETPATFSVSFMIVLSIWLSKIITTVIFD